jgi:hypothetical protein
MNLIITENPLSTCGCRKFHLDTMGDHLCTCTTHSGVKKTHDWVVEQMTDLSAQHIKSKLNT